MPLLNQFQVFLGSILFGGVFFFILTMIEGIFQSKYLKLAKILFQGLAFGLLVYFYYSFLKIYTYGKLNIFFFFALFLGVYLYLKFYYRPIRDWSKKLFLKSNKKLDVIILNQKVRIKTLIKKIKGRVKIKKNKKPHVDKIIH